MTQTESDMLGDMDSHQFESEVKCLWHGFKTLQNLV